MSENLSDFPEALRGEPEVMPWDTGEPLRWQWGRHAGLALREFKSQELIYMRRQVERRNGAGTYFQMYLDEIDAILTERGGEI